MMQVFSGHGSTRWRAGVVVLVLGVTGCDMVEAVQCKFASGPLNMPFCEDISNVPQADFAKYHKDFMDVADTLRPDDNLKLDPRSEMQTGDSDTHVFGQIVAFNGARDLTKKDLEQRPRIIAKVKASRMYDHGIQGNQWSFIVVDGRGKHGWRVLLVSADVKKPVSVLYTAIYQPNPGSGDTPSNGFGASVHLVELTDSAWVETLPPPVRDCKKQLLGACLVNRRSGSSGKQVSDRYDPEDPSLPTDEWVWITKTGCICLGTQCHQS